MLWDAGGNRRWLDRASHGADILGDGTVVFGHGPVPCTEPTLTLSPSGFAEQNLERQVLQTQCRRLEAQHYSLSLTAEQLSHSMAVSGAEAPKSSRSTPIHLVVPHPLQYPIPCNSPSPAIPHPLQHPIPISAPHPGTPHPTPWSIQASSASHEGSHPRSPGPEAACRLP